MRENTQLYQKQIETYKNLYHIYVKYAAILDTLLQTVSGKYAPTAIVQTRAKSLSSFAEKIVRKNYSDPLQQMTDLCGARVITTTLGEVDRICDFINRHFIIDKKKSIDKRSLLKVSEFGYLSVHYIVSPKEKTVLGIEFPEELFGKKAEIQIRTLLQHAWADISHDRLYKTAVKVPDSFGRDVFQVAALLENADKIFSRVASSLDLYSRHYEAFIPAGKLKEKQNKLETIFQNEPDPVNKPAIALRLCRIYREQNEWQKIIRLLSTLSTKKDDLELRILTELGNAYCRINFDDPASAEFGEGTALLSEAGKPATDCAGIQPGDPDIDKLRADALYLLAKALSRRAENDQQVRDLFCQACRLDESNPYFLTAYLEYEILVSGRREHIHFMEPMLKEAIRRSKSHIAMGLEISNAYFTIGKLELILDHTSECLSAYAKALHLCTAGRCEVISAVLEQELNSVQNLTLKKPLEGLPLMVSRLIGLVWTVKNSQRERLKPFANQFNFGDKQIVVLAGGIDHLQKSKMDHYRVMLEKGLAHFKGTIISGGTDTGIPGLAGECFSKIKKTERGQKKLIGYAPCEIPEGVKYDEMNYTQILQTTGHDFSELEAIQYWTDLIYYGIDPVNVRLLGIGGGPISRFEYELALCMGAKVALLDNSSHAVHDITNDSYWAKVPNLLNIPHDVMTVVAFFNMDRSSGLSEKQVEEAARQVHDNFRKMKKEEAKDAALLDWEKLSDDIQESNREQVRYMEKALCAAGYVVRKSKDPEKIVQPVFSDEEVEIMAEIEHGRWNMERLASGWKYNKNKNTELKHSPYIVGWDDLADNVKNWDREPIKKWPGILQKAGFEIIKTTE